MILNRVYRGILRKEDVREEHKDEVEMYKSFRPGDIILARIVSIISFIQILFSLAPAMGVTWSKKKVYDIVWYIDIQS